MKRTSMPLKIFDGRTPNRRFYSHIDVLIDTDLDKLKTVMEEIMNIWKRKQEGHDATEALKQLESDSKLKKNDIDSLFGLVPFMGSILAGGRYTEEDMAADLASMGMAKKTVKWFVSFFHKKKDVFEQELLTKDEFVLPSLREAMYRVDLGLKSSERPTRFSPRVMVRLVLSDKTRRFELKSEDLRHLINVLQSAQTHLTKVQSMVDEGKLSSLYESLNESCQ